MELVKEEIRRIILFAPVPKQDDLYCILCKINLLSTGSNCFKSSFQMKILKCRMLIFSDMRVIASPADGMNNEIYVIMSKDYYKTGEIQDHFQRIGISAGRSISITKSVYEDCLRYTILARIAPLWNQVGSYLVKGRNFLQQKEPLFAVILDVIMTGKEMSITIWPHRLRIYSITVEELMEEKKDQLSSKSEVEIERKWVHVLPSLKNAYVVSVSKRIPDHCQFSSYKQLKRYWKNNYGYRLPEEEDCLFYVTLVFGNSRPQLGPNGWSGPVYIYPGQCICLCPPVVLRCIDQTVPIKAFLHDLSTYVPHICDHDFAAEDMELGYAIPKLHSCNNNNGESSSMKPNVKCVWPFKEALRGMSFVPMNLPSSTLMLPPNSSADMHPIKRLETTSLKDSQSCAKQGEYSMTSDKDSKSTTLTYQIAKQDKIRYAPVFKSKIRPSFLDSKLHIDQDVHGSKGIICKTLNKTKQNSNKLEQVKKVRGENDKRKQEKRKTEDMTVTNSQCLSQSQTHDTNRNDVFFKEMANDLKKSSSTNGLQEYFLRTENTVSDFKLHIHPIQNVKCDNTAINLCLQSSASTAGPSTVSKSMPLSEVNNTDGSIETMANKKNKASRSRPVAQVGLDVEGLAMEGMLNKANTTTLISWLRSKGVTCRVKDKKSDLVCWVEEYLGLPQRNNNSLPKSIEEINTPLF